MKKYRFVISVLGLALSVSAVNAQVPAKLTLKECIETAIANNLQVRQAAYQAQADKVDYQQSRANRLPFISGNISHGMNQGRSIDPFTNSYLNQEIGFANYSINTSITLWNGSAIQNNIRQNELNAKASELNWQQVKDNITINVILAYLQLLSNTEQLDIAQKQVMVTKAQVDRLNTLNDNGAIAPATLYDLKGQLGNDELNLLSIRNNLETAKINLSQLMNIPYQSSMTVESLQSEKQPVLYETSATDVYQAATQQLAMIKAADLRVLSTKKGLASIRGQLLPTLSLNGGLGTNYSSVASRQLLTGSGDVQTPQYVTVNNTRFNVFAPQNNYTSQKISYGDQWKNNFNSSVSISLQIPILNRLVVRNRIKQAEIQQNRAVFESSTTKTQVHQAVDQAYVNMSTALERFQTLQKQVEDFRASFQAAEVRFNNGVNTTVEYMLAKNNLDRANANFVAAKYDYLLRIKILDFYQGKPLW
ncbi:MAG: TolC family protein [Chitinophagaceae bacterium]|nr:TolC family protein [Chitinophagaceae bacterium]